MVQGLPARVPAQAGVWVEAKARVEAEWVAHSPQDLVETVYVQAAAIKSRILSDNRVIKTTVQNVVRK